jgi:hypothetical protein
MKKTSRDKFLEVNRALSLEILKMAMNNIRRAMRAIRDGGPVAKAPRLTGLASPQAPRTAFADAVAPPLEKKPKGRRTTAAGGRGKRSEI